MKKIYESIKNVDVVLDAAGRFGYSKKMSKYYLACLSYVANKNVQMNFNEANLKEIQAVFERVYLNQASDEDKAFANEFMKMYSLEDMVKEIIPQEYDNVYTFANRCSALEVNELIRTLRSTFGNGGKTDVIAAYLNYCLDDKDIKANIQKQHIGLGVPKVKTIND